MKEKSTQWKNLLAGFSLGAITVGAVILALDASPVFLGNKASQDKVPIRDVSSLEKVDKAIGLLSEKNPTSEDLKQLLIESINGKGYGRVAGIYDTEIENIKEVYSPEGVFYLSSDGKYAFFGDLVDVDKNVSKTEIADRIFAAQLSIANAASQEYSRSNPIFEPMQKYQEKSSEAKSGNLNVTNGLNKSLPSRSEDAKALNPDALKNLTQQLIKEKKSGAIQEQVLDKSGSDVDERLAEFRKKWKERIESKMAKKFDKTATSHSSHSSHSSHLVDDSSEQKSRVDISKLHSGGAFVTYKGKRKSKIGYDTKGKKLSEEETRNQIKDMYNNLDKIGEKWSVVYPAIGEEKIGVMVFSDPTCPYCQKLHESIPTLNKAGVKVTILMYPRALALEKSRPEAANKVMASLHSAWCSATPAESLTKLYKGESIPVQNDCSIAKEQGRVDFPAAYQYFLGKLFNLKGTPLSFTSEGYIVRGFSNSNKFLNEIGLTHDKRNKVKTEITVSGLE